MCRALYAHSKSRIIIEYIIHYFTFSYSAEQKQRHWSETVTDHLTIVL